MPTTYRVADEAARASALELLTVRFARIGYAGASAPPAGAHVLVAEEEGRVVATVSLVIEGDVAHLVRLALAAKTTEVLVGLFDLARQHGQQLGTPRVAGARRSAQARRLLSPGARLREPGWATG